MAQLYEFSIGKELRQYNGVKPIMYRLGGQNGDCWECVSHHIEKDGYPRMGFKNRNWKMSRWSYMVSNNLSDLSSDTVIMHLCDNKLCINPNHLQAGTHADNVADKMSKGRGVNPVGEHNGRSKLTKNQVLEIRENDTDSANALAKQFGVSVDAILNIKYKKTWAWLEGEANTDAIAERLTHDQEFAVANTEGYYASIADKFGISIHTVWRIKHKHSKTKRHKEQVFLTDLQKQEIKSSSAKTKELVAAYGVSRSTIKRIRTGLR